MAADLSQIRRFMRGLVSKAERVDRDLKTIAHRRARAVQAGARARVRVDTGKTRLAIEVVDESLKRQFRIQVEDVPGRNPMVPVWIEFGTKHMPARPFLGPAVDESRAAYVQEAEALLSKVMAEGDR